MKRTSAAPALLFALALAGLAAPVAAQTPPPAKPFNVVGDYEFSTTVDNQTLNGVISIVKQNDALTGKIASDMGELPISGVKVEDKKVTFMAKTPEGEDVSFTLTFEDNDKFAGTWTAGGMTGALSGKRKVG